MTTSRANQCSSSSPKVTANYEAEENSATPGAELTYQDGSFTQTLTAGTTAPAYFGFGRDVVISSTGTQVQKGLPVTITASTLRTKLKTPFTIHVVSPTNLPVKTCTNKTSKISFSNLKTGEIDICPKTSGLYKVLAGGISGSTSIFIKVSGSAPTEITNLTLNSVQTESKILMSFGQPIYDGGAPVEKLNYEIACGTKTRKGFVELNPLNALSNVEIPNTTTGRCKISLNVSNKFGSSPTISQFILQH
jgi:hypothetical protein